MTVARRNIRSALIQAGNSAETFRKRMVVLAQHARHDHTECTFHRKILCTCGRCNGKEKLECKGREYHTRHPITCPMHSLAYEIECHYRASQTEKLIHPELGMGYTDQNEAFHNVFIRYRAKTYHMERLHYVVSTNLGLLQSNMTPMFKQKGAQYHWILELFERLNLPPFDGMKEAVLMANTDCMKRIEKSREKQTKSERVKRKLARDHEQAERQCWSQQQNIVHTYGKKECKCGSTTHLRTTSKDCPLRKVKQSSKDVQRDDFLDESSSDGENLIDFLGESSGDELVESSGDDATSWCMSRGRVSLWRHGGVL